MITVKFERIDKMGRPVFKSISSNKRYGSLDKLFYKYATQEDILRDVKDNDLVSFGNKKDCEPQGNKPKDKVFIVRGKQ